MMLSPTRLIGHKEYGNTPPGGYPGRKSDPRYDMNWRRARVANFKPRTGPTPTPVLEEDDMAPWILRAQPGGSAYLIVGDSIAVPFKEAVDVKEARDTEKLLQLDLDPDMFNQVLGAIQARGRAMDTILANQAGTT